MHFVWLNVTSRFKLSNFYLFIYFFLTDAGVDRQIESASWRRTCFMISAWRMNLRAAASLTPAMTLGRVSAFCHTQTTSSTPWMSDGLNGTSVNSRRSPALIALLSAFIHGKSLLSTSACAREKKGKTPA